MTYYSYTNLKNVSHNNKPSLNVSKTELIILGCKQRLCRINDGTKLTCVQKCKHLGVRIDENLLWDDHKCTTPLKRSFSQACTRT